MNFNAFSSNRYRVEPIVNAMFTRCNSALEEPHSYPSKVEAGQFDMLTVLVVILLLIALGALPTWPYSRGWGYYPSSGLGLVVLILVILLLLGRV